MPAHRLGTLVDADRMIVATTVVTVMGTEAVAAESVVAGGEEEEVGTEEGRVATGTATMITKYVFPLLLTDVLTDHALSPARTSTAAQSSKVPVAIEITP